MQEYEQAKSQRRRNLNNKRKQQRQRPSRNSNPSDSHLQQVYKDTVRIFERTKMSPPPAILIDVERIDDIDESSVGGVYPIVEVVNIDTFDMAQQYCDDHGMSVLVLNMASNYKPGGGVRNGRTAQEECLFRRSNAYMTHPATWYPLEPTQVVYSPQVQVIKGSDYQRLSRPFNVGMISVPAIRKPRLLNSEYRDDDRRLMSLKIEAIFKTAIEHGHDALVLGALGCGVFRNPPQQVAAIFKTMIRTYGAHFKRIGFAVLVVKGNDGENLRAFQKLASE
jgi:uncharacterized protein (TIGR02452 family)